jgi:hypothetical protein
MLFKFFSISPQNYGNTLVVPWVHLTLVSRLHSSPKQNTIYSCFKRCFSVFFAVLALAANKADLLDPLPAAAAAQMSEKDRDKYDQVCFLLLCYSKP